MINGWVAGMASLGFVLAASGESLVQEFADPPVAARPSAFWCWLNGSITREQITRDLEEVKVKGMGGLEIWDVSAHRDPGKQVPIGPAFLGDESLDLIAHAIHEGTRLGLRLGMVASSGWNAGGSWVPPKFAGKGLFWSQVTVQGPGRIERKLAFPDCPLAPKGKDGMPLHYREVAVLAVPSGKQLAGIDQVVDLTAMMAQDGTLSWQAPPGDWALLRFVCSNHGQQLIVPSPNSGGPMIDFIDPAATEFHVRHIAESILRKLGRKDFRGTAFQYLEFDSMELAEGVLWSDTFTHDYQARRGYSPVSYLPLFAGWKLADAAADQRFHDDYKLTVSDQLIFSHYVTGGRVLAEYGLHLVAEAGGPGPPIWDSCPVDAIKALGAVEVPRGEFWMGNPKEIFLVKEIASAAHVYGRKLVDAESFTTWRRWIDGPVAHKRLADRALCEGLNHFTLHTLASSPPEAGLPGRAYHAGTDINPNSTWWPKVKPFMDYLGRCAHMLQQGHFVADVCYFYGAQAPNFYPQEMHAPRKIIPEELGLGYDYDVCDAQTLITRMSVKGGRLVLPDGMSYALLAMRGQISMPIDVLRALHRLVVDGATLVGPPPGGLAGLGRPEAERREFDQLVKTLWGGGARHQVGKGAVYQGVSWRKVLGELRIHPDFHVVEEAERDNLDYIHRRVGGMDVYFVRNRTMEAKSLDCLFRANGASVRLCDPLSGEVGPAFLAPAETHGRKVRVDLAPAGSIFLVFENTQPGSSAAAQAPVPPGVAGFELAGPWSLSFPDGWGVNPGTRQIERLGSWAGSGDVAARYFSGTATYATTFELPAGMVRDGLQLELGEVRELAEVFLNGTSLGVVWTPPYRVDFGTALKPGKNEIKVEVTNLWANRMIGDLAHPEQGSFTRTNITRLFSADTEPLPSGLFGPVKVLDR